MQQNSAMGQILREGCAKIIGVIIFITLVVIPCELMGVDKLKIDYSRESKFLPYNFLEKYCYDWGKEKKFVADAMQVYRDPDSPFDSIVVVVAYNPDFNQEQIAVVSYNDREKGKVFDHDPFYMIFSHLSKYYDR